MLRLNVELTHGIFCQEIKNRFRCIVDVDGESLLCYVASSSRLTNYIPLEGKEVLLLPEGNAAHSTRYTLYAVKYKNSYILLNLQLANAVLKEQLQRRCFSGVGQRKLIYREKKIEGYKADLYIEDTETLIEIKTVIGINREVSFPAVNSERSVRQLNEISKLLEEGYKIFLIFAVLSPFVKVVNIDRKSKFYEVFQLCVDKGLKYFGCSLKTTDKDISVRELVDVKL